MMNTWFTLELGDGIMSSGPSDQISETFRSLFEAAGKPADMAIFTRLESEGRLHCEAVAYFSPAASEIAKAFDAEPCDKPERAGLGLLAGDPRCWSVLFPESNSS